MSETCDLCGEPTEGTEVDGVLYCDECLDPEGVTF